MQDFSKVSSDLKNAYAIIDQINDIIHDELIEKQNILPMTVDFQGLESAMAYIGETLEELNDEAADIYNKHVISQFETRENLKKAYRECNDADKNIKPESYLADICAYLKTCFYVILNATYKNQSDAQSSIERVFDICDAGENALNDLEAMPEEDKINSYISPESDKLHDLIPDLQSILKSLRPRFDPDKNNNQEN